MNAVVVAVNFLRTINAMFALQGLPSYIHTISDMSFSTLEIGAAQLRVRLQKSRRYQGSCANIRSSYVNISIPSQYGFRAGANDTGMV